MKEGPILLSLPKLNALLVGAPGSGKSYFMSTFPKPYFIVTEREPQGLAISPTSEEPYSVYVETWEELEAVIADIIAGKRAAEYKSICLDSITDVSPILISYLQRIEKKPTMTLPMWGLAVSYLRVLIRRLTREIGSKFNVVVSARATTEKDEVTGALVGRPITIGKSFPDDIGGYFDCVFYMEQVMEGIKPVWKIHTKTHEHFHAKDGLGGYLAPVEVGGYPDLWKKLVKGLQERQAMQKVTTANVQKS